MHIYELNRKSHNLSHVEKEAWIRTLTNTPVRPALSGNSMMKPPHANTRILIRSPRILFALLRISLVYDMIMPASLPSSLHSLSRRPYATIPRGYPMPLAAFNASSPCGRAPSWFM